MPLPLGVLRPTFEDIVSGRMYTDPGTGCCVQKWRKAEGSSDDRKVIEGGVALAWQNFKLPLVELH